MRIAVGGISHESNSFTPLTTGLELFSIRRGEEMVRGDPWDRFRAQGVEFVPTLMAGAAPHGLVRKDAYLQLKGELLETLERALPVDGVFLSLHGAMEVEEIGDGESDLASAVRACVGDAVLIAASLDLHGNIAPAFVQAANMMTALRTAPHRDGPETRERALTRLISALRNSIRPRTAMVKLPLLLPGEHAVTDVEPARSLYGMLERIEAEPGLMDASLMIGCAWTDSPYTSVSTLVVAEADVGLASRHAARLAAEVWEQRRAFRPDTETLAPEEAVAVALSSSDTPVFISDSGDNVTAGGAGDLPLLLECLMTADASRAVVAGIADREAVERCAAAGVGGRLTVAIGGKLDQIHGRPLEVTGKVQHLDPPVSPTLAVLGIGDVAVVLTADRRAFITASSFEAAGIDPARQQVIVVKLGYLFPELRRIAARSVMALSPGFTDLRLERLPYRRVQRPIYPLDQQVVWQAPVDG